MTLHLEQQMSHAVKSVKQLSDTTQTTKTQQPRSLTASLKMYRNSYKISDAAFLLHLSIL